MDNMSGIRQTLQAEATRRAGGLGGSTAGTSPNPSASSPIQSNPMATQINTGSPTMPTQDNPFGGASAAMNGSMPLKGGTAIEKALIKRMQAYPPA